MHGPPTLASPTGQSPPPGRGPLFFVALIVLLLLAIAAGALVVWIVFARKPEPSQQARAPDALAPSVATHATPVAEAGATPDGKPAPPMSVASHVANTTARPSSVLGCLCVPNQPPTGSLCATNGIAHCHCLSPQGTLCGIPWVNGDCPTWGDFGLNATAKDGDPCTGVNSVGVSASGQLEACATCIDVETYPGKEGTPCVGWRGDRTKATGTVRCSNLEMECNRNGNSAACAALAAHK